MGPDKDFEYTFRPGLGTHPYSWLKVGQPVGVFYGYIMDGIYHSREQIDAGNEPTASLGQKIYRDINGDGVVSIEDQTTIGDPNPDFFGGINNTFTYKNFTLAYSCKEPMATIYWPAVTSCMPQSIPGS